LVKKFTFNVAETTKDTVQEERECSVADPDPGSSAQIRIREENKSGFGINIPDHNSESLMQTTIFWVKNI
jgi:hypothetical protein